MFADKNPVRHPRSVVAIALVVMGMLLSACSGPGLSDASSAARVNGQSISMTQYLAVSRLLFELRRAQSTDPSAQATWQQISGKADLVTVQQQAITVLVQNMLLDKYATDPKNGIDVKALRTQEDSQIQQAFAQIPAQFRPLVDQGILTQATYRPLLHNSLIIQAVFPKLHFTTAHIRILTVKTQQQANDILITKKLSSDNWTELATKNSIDPARANGGDIAELVPGVFPGPIDQAVFGPQTLDPKAISAPIKSTLGWSLIQVVSRTPNVAGTDLDSQAPVYPGGTQSIQGAAFFGWLSSIYAKTPHTINVNWCGAVSGKDCGSPIPADQVTGP